MSNACWLCVSAEDLVTNWTLYQYDKISCARHCWVRSTWKNLADAPHIKSDRLNLAPFGMITLQCPGNTPLSSIHYNSRWIAVAHAILVPSCQDLWWSYRTSLLWCEVRVLAKRRDKGFQYSGCLAWSVAHEFQDKRTPVCYRIYDSR